MLKEANEAQCSIEHKKKCEEANEAHYSKRPMSPMTKEAYEPK